MKQPPQCQISFIVPAYNEARMLGATLSAIHVAATQAGESYEIIVADDDSTDATAAIAAAKGARVIPVRNRNIGRTRNDGARHARGIYLFFVDADTLIDHRVLRAALNRLFAGDVGGGAVFHWDADHGGIGRMFEFAVGTITRSLGLASGCFVYASRSAFEAVGGFDASLLASEEWTLSRALRKLGPFRVLAEPVVTSGRKLAALRVRDVLLLGLQALRGGTNVRRQRSGFTDLWYSNPPR